MDWCVDPCGEYFVDASECLPVCVQPPAANVASGPRWVQPTPTATSVPYPSGAFAVAPSVGTRGRHLAGLSLSPTRLIAPVGREVVLLAGLCSADGYLLKRQPIEWSLSPDSVGSFVEVDEYANPVWRKLLHKYPEKRSGSYAVGRTSTAPQVLTRGTLDQGDDIWLQEGQTWISVTSPNAGVSHVTAVAPTAVGWSERRQSATIHWIDAQWMFPPPVIASVDAPQTLTTRVVRATDGSPIPGWIVRYEIVGGPAGAAGSQVEEVYTDANGNAGVVVTPQGGQPGVTQINMQVIRIGTAAGDIPRQSIGQGSTTVTWAGTGAGVPPSSTPPAIREPAVPQTTLPATTPAKGNLQLSIEGPQTVNANSSIPYRISVANPGSTAIRDVDVYAATPFGLQYESSDPRAEDVGGRVRWRFPELPPGSTQALTAKYRVVGSGSVRICATATSRGEPAGEDCTDTQVLATAAPVAGADRLRLDITGPAIASVGEQITHQIAVTNESSVTVPNVMLTDRFDAGLAHSRDRGGREVSNPLGTIPPGATVTTPIRFSVVNPGQLCHTVTLTSGSGGQTSKSACINATVSSAAPAGTAPGTPIPGAEAGQPALSLRVSGPAARRVNEEAEFQIELANFGTAALTNVSIVDEFDPAIEPTFASDGNNRQGDRLTWFIPSMPAGSSQVLRVVSKCRQVNPAACHTVVVTTAEGIRRSDTACIRITEGVNSAIPTLGPLPGRANRNNPGFSHSVVGPHRPTRGLSVAVADLRDPATVGVRTTYVVTIRNDGYISDRDVALTVTLPHGARYETSINPPMVRARAGSVGRRLVEFLPIAELRAGETATYRVVTTAAKTGAGIFRAEVTSRRSRSPIVAEEETTFFAP